MSKKEQRQAKTKRPPRRLWLWGIVGMGAVGLIALIGVFQASQSSLEAQPLPKRGDQSLLQNVQSFPSEGAEHVPEGTQIAYNTNPPTSGKHYGRETPAGFYIEPRLAGNLVLNRYDILTIRAFLAEYLGRGPENPVR